MKNNDFGIPGVARSVAKTILDRIKNRGERIWRFADFQDLVPTAVAQALSRLCRQGFLQRLGKGVYYRPVNTPSGPSKPNPAMLPALPWRQGKVFPTGPAAARLLGLTRQQPGSMDKTTGDFRLTQLIVGDTIPRTRRPADWRLLSEKEVAILDILRSRGSFSELSAEETVSQLLVLLREEGLFDRILGVVKTEPPRVRAMLGALGQEIGISEVNLNWIRSGLNPISRFDFGILSVLKYASKWQARSHRPNSYQAG